MLKKPPPPGAARARPARRAGLATRGRIVRILPENALRFVLPAPRSTWRSPGPGGPSIAVAYAGPGVAVEDRELIFERFARGQAQDDG